MNININEVAKRFGVPLLKTCQELDWQSETLFYWDISDTNEIRLRYANTVPQDANKNDFVPAPQMHEITPLLPIEIYRNSKIKKLGIDSNIYQIFEIYGGGRICYNGNKENDDRATTDIITVAEVVIINYHFAEAYAELYLQLKGKELI
jgi:hypothetical protein